MSKIYKSLWITLISIIFLSFFAISNASAQALSCVQKLLDWNNKFGFNFVSYTAVSLHSPSNIASFTTGSNLENSTCLVRQISSFADVPCLRSKNRDQMLLNNRFSFNQPFDVNKPVNVKLDITPDSNSLAHIRTPTGAPYAFYPRCVGDLIVGDDQWHNHWTLAFKLGSHI